MMNNRKQLAESGLAIVANINTDHDLIQWAKATWRFVYIGRKSKKRHLPESKWRNENTMVSNTQAERDRVCDAFGARPTFPAADLAELKGKVLVCYCHPKRCHGDYLAALANGL